MFHIFGALAEFERDLIRERTTAGLEAARARGRTGGRPRSMTRKKVELASKMLANREISVPEVLQAIGVSQTTLYRHVPPDGTVRSMPES